MSLTLLQLNINSDNFWNKLISFLTSHDFDIIQLQELTGKGTVSGSGTIHSQRDTFTELQQVLKDKYKGELAIAAKFTSSHTAYMGNATFYKKELSLISKNIKYLHKTEKPFLSDAATYEDQGRAMLHLQLDYQGKAISFVNAHLAWAKTPKEEPHQTAQAQILIEYLKQTPSPFIFSGDCNLDPYQPTIKKLETLTRNLTTQNNITNTLNPRTHRAKQLFPPGVTVDYIFVTPDIKVEKFAAITEDISDHYGLTVTFTI